MEKKCFVMLNFCTFVSISGTHMTHRRYLGKEIQEIPLHELECKQHSMTQLQNIELYEVSSWDTTYLLHFSDGDEIQSFYLKLARKNDRLVQFQPIGLSVQLRNINVVKINANKHLPAVIIDAGTPVIYIMGCAKLSDYPLA